MNIIAYTYEADYHCIDCTITRFCDCIECETDGTEMNIATFKPKRTDENGIWFEQRDSEGNWVFPLFPIDEWQNFDDSFLADNPVQYLTCGDCHEVIDEYKTDENGIWYKHQPIKGNNNGIQTI